MRMPGDIILQRQIAEKFVLILLAVHSLLLLSWYVPAIDCRRKLSPESFALRLILTTILAVSFEFSCS